MLMISCFLTIIPNGSKANSGPKPVKTQNTGPAAEAEANALITRLNEINSIDKSAMSRREKRALRKEVRSLDSRLRVLNGGIYLSVGTIILILILLIIFL